MAATPSSRSLLRLGVVGVGQRGTARAEAIAARDEVALVGVTDADPPRAAAAANRHGTTAYRSAAALLADCDAVCIAAPTRDHFLIAEAAAKDGRHVFLEWPATTSVAECERLVALSEEAGVDIGVAHPLPIAPLLASRPAGWRPRFVALDLPARGLSWPFLMAGALDLAAALARSADVPRLDAEADRRGALLDTVGATLRFRAGTLVHLLLGAAASSTRLFVAGRDQRATLTRLDAALDFGTAAPVRASSVPGNRDGFGGFLDALAAGRPVPRTALDALHTMRLTERLLAKLR
ncbi:MAG: Gfo/Idh/MocA family oxidoreductase [Bacteroidota bacterium]